MLRYLRRRRLLPQSVDHLMSVVAGHRLHPQSVDHLLSVVVERRLPQSVEQPIAVGCSASKSVIGSSVVVCGRLFCF